MSQNETEVFVDPSCRMLYASFYIQGLIDLYGFKQIRFRSGLFNDLLQDNRSAYDQYMAIVFQDKSSIKRVIVDFRDDTSIDESALDWSDVYAKINFNVSKSINKAPHKIKYIGPSFAVKVFNNFHGAYLGMKNYFSFENQIPFRNFISGYITKKRLPLTVYSPGGEVSANYVFSIATLWDHPNCMDEANPWRHLFMRICREKSKGLQFEGGFIVRTRLSKFAKYRDCVLSDKSVPLKSYLKKTKKSLFVFNTPAVHGCHGWKLGEYLALGKAIISTPLKNELPVPLEHGKNIHFVSSEQQLKDAVSILRDDEKYRSDLEKGAYQYWLNYVHPMATMKIVMEN